MLQPLHVSCSGSILGVKITIFIVHRLITVQWQVVHFQASYSSLKCIYILISDSVPQSAKKGCVKITLFTAI